MSLSTIFIIAVGLSMDAFAVSVASGSINRNISLKSTTRLALFFGIFQGIMPPIGWLAGSSLRSYISAFDHWVAFILLGAIGGKMIYESFKIDQQEKCVNLDCYHVLLLLAIATSIDALVVGLTLSFLQVAIVVPSVIIGIVTFLFSLGGVFIGKKMGHLFESKIELIGGLVLIAIGLKILLSHLISG